jgi:hypothetical protein
MVQCGICGRYGTFSGSCDRTLDFNIDFCVDRCTVTGCPTILGVEPLCRE